MFRKEKEMDMQAAISKDSRSAALGAGIKEEALVVEKGQCAQSTGVLEEEKPLCLLQRIQNWQNWEQAESVFQWALKTKIIDALRVAEQRESEIDFE